MREKGRCSQKSGPTPCLHAPATYFGLAVGLRPLWELTQLAKVEKTSAVKTRVIFCFVVSSGTQTRVPGTSQCVAGSKRGGRRNETPSLTPFGSERMTVN